ncbi:hypothetical protein KJ764_05735, partial [Patescibacteria group bacterium]|nr:hypothetical protein [Patescibacteria group bacterium]
SDLQARLKEKKITIELTPGGLDNLAKMSYDPEYGARPVRRTIQDHIEDPLAQGMLEGEFKEGASVKVLKDGDGVKLGKSAK